jgi:hypothetical protein
MGIMNHPLKQVSHASTLTATGMGSDLGDSSVIRNEPLDANPALKLEKENPAGSVAAKAAPNVKNSEVAIARKRPGCLTAEIKIFNMAPPAGSNTYNSQTVSGTV